MGIKLKDLAESYCITDGKKFRLKDFDPADTGKFKSKDQAQELLADGVERLSEMQEKLYAQDNWSLLLIFQAMDAAGKDSTIKMVMSGVNPQGCQVFSFKAPSAEELDHDFFWRAARCLPERGRIGIFNRSYYEEMLVVRVHPEFLAKQKLPPSAQKNIWAHRFEDVNAIEKYLARNGIIPIKFFLNLSKDVQLKRFIKRVDKPNKNWKFSEADFKERGRWDDYMAAYEDMLKNTSTAHAPWYVIPADNKWYTREAVAEVVVKRMQELDLRFPEVPDARHKELLALRKKLLAS